MGKGKKKSQPSQFSHKALNEEKKKKPKGPATTNKRDKAAAVEEAAVAAKAAAPQGCIVPFLKRGCLEGKGIPAGAAKPPDGAVRVKCMLTVDIRNEECAGVPWLHAQCFEELVDKLSDELMRTNPRCRAWSKKFAMDNLWKQGKGLDLVYSLLSCPAAGCHGYLIPDEDWEALKPKAPPVPKAQPTAQAAADAKPALNHNMRAGKNKAKAGGGGIAIMYKGASASNIARGAEFNDQLSRVKARVVAEQDAKDRVERMRYLPPGAPGWAAQRDAEAAKEAKAAQPLPPPPPKSAFPSLPADADGPGPSYSGIVGSKETPWAFAATSDLVPRAVTTPEGERLIQELKTMACMDGGAIWEKDPRVEVTVGNISVTLMCTIADLGGLDAWLEALDTPLQLVGGRFVVRGMANVPHRLKGLGRVESMVDPENFERIDVVVDCEAYQTKFLFDRSSTLLDSEGRAMAQRLLVDDWLTFKAEEAADNDHVCHTLGIKWKIREAVLVQRAGEAEQLLQDPAPAQVERRVQAQVEYTPPPLAAGGQSFDFPEGSGPTSATALAPQSEVESGSGLDWMIEELGLDDDDDDDLPDTTPTAHPLTSPPSAPSGPTAPFGAQPKPQPSVANAPGYSYPVPASPQRFQPPPPRSQAAAPIQPPTAPQAQRPQPTAYQQPQPQPTAFHRAAPHAPVVVSSSSASPTSRAQSQASSDEARDQVLKLLRGEIGGAETLPSRSPVAQQPAAPASRGFGVPAPRGFGGSQVRFARAPLGAIKALEEARAARAAQDKWDEQRDRAAQEPNRQRSFSPVSQVDWQPPPPQPAQDQAKIRFPHTRPLLQPNMPNGAMGRSTARFPAPRFPVGQAPIRGSMGGSARFPSFAQPPTGMGPGMGGGMGGGMGPGAKPLAEVKPGTCAPHSSSTGSSPDAENRPAEAAFPPHAFRPLPHQTNSASPDSLLQPHKPYPTNKSTPNSDMDGWD